MSEVFEWALIRVVPRVDRGEAINAGVIVYSKSFRYLKTRIELDERRVRALDPDADLTAVRAALTALELACTTGPLAELTLGERFESIGFLIRDRGSNFTASFDAVFQTAGTRIVHTAVQAPRMNAICERLVGTLRRELLDRVLILGEGHLHAVLAEYQVHYNTAWPHQGIAQRVPDGGDDDHLTVADLDRERIRRKPVLSGLINEYSRAA